jgi:predicted nuclease of predicted toxin-antitoxin system
MPSFFIDECVSSILARMLRDKGFDVVEAKDICRGEVDERALAVSFEAGRILITDDWDFGELTIRRELRAEGIIILGLYALPNTVRDVYAADRISEIASSCAGHITIIEPGRVRTRPLPETSG